MKLKSFFLIAAALVIFAACDEKKSEETPTGPSETAKLQTPENLAAVETEAGYVELSWSEVAEATGYKVYRSVDAADYTVVGTPTTTSFTDQSVANTALGATLYYKVQATSADSNADSYLSDSVAITVENGVNFVPKNLAASHGSFGVNLAWSAVSGADSYSIFRSLNGTTFDSVGYTVNPAFYESMPTFELGATITYKVRATANLGDTAVVFSSFSNVSTVGGTKSYRIAPFDEFGNQYWMPYQSADEDKGSFTMGDMTNSTKFALFYTKDESTNDVQSSCLFMQQTYWGETAGFPLYITIDLQESTKAKALFFRMRQRVPIGSSRYPVDFDVWGSSDPKSDADFETGGVIDTVASLNYWTSWGTLGGRQINGEDAWTKDGSWTRLHSAERLSAVLPSGIIYYSEWPENTTTGEKELSSTDQDYCRSGFLFLLDNPTASRYIRFRIFDTSDNSARNEWEFMSLLSDE